MVYGRSDAGCCRTLEPLQRPRCAPRPSLREDDDEGYSHDDAGKAGSQQAIDGGVNSERVAIRLPPATLVAMIPEIHIDGSGSLWPSPGPVSDILDAVPLADHITHVTVIAADGYRASIPVETLRIGGVLSVEDGGWRLRVIDGDTLCWNVKGVVSLEPTRGKVADDIPENPSH